MLQSRQIFPRQQPRQGLQRQSPDTAPPPAPDDSQRTRCPQAESAFQSAAPSARPQTEASAPRPTSSLLLYSAPSQHTQTPEAQETTDPPSADVAPLRAFARMSPTHPKRPRCGTALKRNHASHRQMPAQSQRHACTPPSPPLVPAPAAAFHPVRSKPPHSSGASLVRSDTPFPQRSDHSQPARSVRSPSPPETAQFPSQPAILYRQRTAILACRRSQPIQPPQQKRKSSTPPTLNQNPQVAPRRRLHLPKQR